jgi:hypothetical protein
MTFPRLMSVAGVCAVLAVAAPQSAEAQASQRVVYASALDQEGVPVPDLGPRDFVVREDKVAREILAVAPAADPMQIALLVDNSQASEQFIRDYREALPAFINAIAADENGARHQLAVITLGERPTINTDYTFDLAQAAKNTQRIFAVPGSGTYLLDGLIETSRGVTRKNFSRPVIVAVITEGPELSDRFYQTVLEPLRASGAAFHVVTVGSPSNTAHDRGVVLAMGTRDSGGRNDTILTSTALPARMKQVAAELLHQYKITYARPQTLIPPEQVTVTSAKPGVAVRGTAARDASGPERGRP